MSDTGLVKTIKFSKPKYIGDPSNTCRIFNELEVDELCFLDILATPNRKEPNYAVLSEISNECFMPLSYGGGIDSFERAAKVFEIGFEKVIINSALFTKPNLISEIANVYGSQAVVASVDVKKNVFGNYQVYGNHGLISGKKNPVDFVKELEERGVGEIMLNNIDREGTWQGFDITLIEQICNSTTVPVIAHGGAGSIKDIGAAVKKGHASAVALGSMVVYQAKGMGVLINFPDRELLTKEIA